MRPAGAAGARSMATNIPGARPNQHERRSGHRAVSHGPPRSATQRAFGMQTPRGPPPQVRMPINGGSRRGPSSRNVRKEAETCGVSRDGLGPRSGRSAGDCKDSGSRSGAAQADGTDSTIAGAVGNRRVHRPAHRDRPARRPRRLRQRRPRAGPVPRRHQRRRHCRAEQPYRHAVRPRTRCGPRTDHVLPPWRSRESEGRPGRRGSPGQRLWKQDGDDVPVSDSPGVAATGLFRLLPAPATAARCRAGDRRISFQQARSRRTPAGG